jgi:hypothetical protein
MTAAEMQIRLVRLVINSNDQELPFKLLEHFEIEKAKKQASDNF